MEIKVSICSFLPLLPPQNIMADQHVTTQNPACLYCRVETSSFHSRKPVRNKFFLPASSCLCVSLHICIFHLAHEEQTPSSLLRVSAYLGGWIWGAEEWIFCPTSVVENGSCLSCALKAIFALIVISKEPMALLSYALCVCSELACTQ